MKILKYIIFTLFLFGQTNVFGQYAFCNVSDSLALVKLGTHLLGSGGSPLIYGAWTPSLPVSAWSGVDTVNTPNSTSGYRVRRVNLSNSSLTGYIDAPLFNGDSLHYMEELDLSNNFLDSLSHPLRDNNAAPIPLLRQLNLSYNNFTVRRSDSLLINLLEHMDNVERLDISQIFTSTGRVFWYGVGIPSANNLKVFLSEKNHLQGYLSLDTLLANFQSLEVLKLSENSLTRIEINGLNTSLTEMEIHQNDMIDFDDIDAMVNRLRNLQKLDARAALDTSIADSFVLQLANSRDIFYLDLSHNNLRGELPIVLFEKLPKLEELYLQNNHLRGGFPEPFNLATTGYFQGAKYYWGTRYLKKLDLSNNRKLGGALRLDWLLLKQLKVHAGISNNNGINVPLEYINVANNRFAEVLPRLNNPVIDIILGTNLDNRFIALQRVDVSNNSFDFKDMYRMARIFNMNQTVANGFVLSNTSAIPSDFAYFSQDSIGEGGVKRRSIGDSLVFDAGRGVVVQEMNGRGAFTTVALRNTYSWEKININGLADSIGIVNFNSFVAPQGGVNPSYRGANGHLGVAASRHLLGVVGIDSSLHHNQRYTSSVTNELFPNLVLFMKQKKIEVGNCFDASGNIIQCQTMIVQFKPSVLQGLNAHQQDSLKKAVRESIGAKPISECLCGDVELWEIADTAMVEGFGKGTKKATNTTSARPELQSADPNYALLPDTTSSIVDSLTIQAGQGNRSATTLVAIIDAGIDYNYMPLRSFISEGAALGDTCLSSATWGYNFLDNNNNASDDHGHGTAIAGIITGLSKQNLLPYTAQSTRDIGILPLKYTDKKGSGTVFNATCALHYAANYKRITTNNDTAKVRVINCSWGYYGDPCMVLENALDYVGNDCGILVVASAGNKGISVEADSASWHWPSNSISPELQTTVDNILAVTALPNHTSDRLETVYANYSPRFIDLAAQGSDSTTQAGTNGGFNAVYGTSFAAAQVSRAAAFLFDKYPEASYFAVKFALMQGVDTLQSADAVKLKSQGRLNYIKADSIMNLIADRSLCDENITVAITSITEKETRVQLYPNPVAGLLNIELDHSLLANKMVLKLYNLQGVLIQQQSYTNGEQFIQLSTQDLAKGVYLLHIQIADKQLTKKFVKL